MLGFILQILLPLSVIGISFAGGYALRDWQSRRRRAAEREKYYEKHPEARPD